MRQFKRKFRTSLFVILAMCSTNFLVKADNIVPKTSNITLNNTLEEASRYYEATLFDRAIPILKDLLTNLHSNTEQRAWVRLRLGQCYYFTNQFANVPEVLKEVNPASRNNNPVIQNFNNEAIFLSGLSYSKLGRIDQAISAFLNYLTLEENRPLPFHFDALYELGVAYFKQEKYDEAKKQFKEIQPQSGKKRHYPLSQVYLARMAITEKNYTLAEKLIENLDIEVSIDEIFPFTLTFLQGETHFSRGNWEKAIHHFSKAIPTKNPQMAGWTEDSLFYLGWCYLNLAEENNTDEIKLRQHLTNCEQIFIKLIEISPSDRAYLGLGQCYLTQGNHLKDNNALHKLEILLSEKEKFKTRQSLHHALLLRAQASPSYEERKKLFRQLTIESNNDSPYFGNAWYLKGVNEFDEGQEHIISGKKQSSLKHFEYSLKSFNRAFDLLYPTDKKLAALSLKFQVQAYYHLNTKEGFLKGLAVLGKILNQYRDDLFLELDDPGEIFFLQGLIASNLIECDEGHTFYNIAESSLIHTIDSYPKGEYYDESLRLLGTLYYSSNNFQKAQDTFLMLTGKIPPSPFSGEAYFWASNSSEMLNEDHVKTKYFRRKVYEQYPDSPYSAEAFFRYYDYAEYLRGNTQAVDHLMTFLERYPESPFVLNSLYLIGLSHLQEKKSPDGKWNKEKDYESAIEAFSQLENVFNHLYKSNHIPQEKISYFINILYRAKLEKGLALLSQAEEYETAGNSNYLLKAEKCLHQMYTDFDNPNHPFTTYLVLGESLTRLQEESGYHLARCYILEGDDEAACRLLEKMIEKYKNAKVTRGVYLSKIWYEMGKIIARQKDYSLAIQYFKNSEDAAKGKILRPDELLELWIEQSYCHQCSGEMGEAMLILSRVINYDAVSPNRLKAMFLRALIYEEEGRLELARRQLEAVAKKGGKWSIKAKEKLEESYVYQ